MGVGDCNNYLSKLIFSQVNYLALVPGLPVYHDMLVLIIVIVRGWPTPCYSKLAAHAQLKCAYKR